MRWLSERVLLVAAAVLAVVLVAAVTLAVWVVRLPAMDPVPMPTVSQG